VPGFWLWCDDKKAMDKARRPFFIFSEMVVKVTEE